MGIIIISSQQHPLRMGERRVRLVTNLGALLDFAHLILIICLLNAPVHLVLTNLFFLNINLDIIWTPLGMVFLIFSYVVIWLMLRFSIYYLHRDAYYYKFFVILYILQISLTILALNYEVESIFIGWELLGLSSVLLIAFYEHRTSVLKNSLRILVIYKISDLIFYSVLIYSLAHGITNYTAIDNFYSVALILLACLIKSSIFPLFWLPRTMEGPTPSSAIFYGGLATHIPIFVLLNVWEVKFLSQHPALCSIFIILLIVSAIWSNLLCRICSDIKNSLAYATITQLSIIYLEVVLGFYELAVIHCICHGLYRSFQFLRSPSLLYFSHQTEKNRKRFDNLKGKAYIKLIPQSLQPFLYRIVYTPLLFQKVLIQVIESFMGLYSYRSNFRGIIAYAFCSITLLLIVHVTSSLVFYGYINILNSANAILLFAYLFNLLALMNKYDPKLFFVSLSISVSLTLFALLPHTLLTTSLLNLLVFLIGSYFVYLFVTNKSVRHTRVYYEGRQKQSTSWNVAILVLGLSITGVPGLGSFILWEQIGHSIVHSHPAIIIDGFCLLTLNMLVFFRFYYSNYLGTVDELASYWAVDRG